MSASANVGSALNDSSVSGVASGDPESTFTMPLHSGYLEQPQKPFPVRLPFLAVRLVIGPSHIGHGGDFTNSSRSEDNGLDSWFPESAPNVGVFDSEGSVFCPWIFSLGHLGPLSVRIGLKQTGQASVGTSIPPQNRP